MYVGDTCYREGADRSRDLADQQLTTLAEIGLERVEIDWPMVMQAARYKSRHKISYAAAFAAALAKQRNAEPVTGDPEFRTLASEISIHWL